MRNSSLALTRANLDGCRAKSFGAPGGIHMTGKRIFWLLAGICSVLAILLSSCQDFEMTDVKVDTATPAIEVLRTEDIPLPNCGGSGELSQSLGMVTTVQKSLSLSAKASGSAGTAINIPAATKLQLEVEIEATYQQTYQTASSRLDTIVMKAAPGTHIIYTVQWEKHEFTSAVSFAVKGEVYRAPYTYTLVVPKIISSDSVSCSEVSPEITSTPAQITSISSPTSTPAASASTLTPAADYACGTANEQPQENSKLKRGQSFKVSFTLVNTGSAVWPDDLTLDISSNPSGTVDAAPLPIKVPRVQPGDSINVGPFDAKAPNKEGHYVVGFNLGDGLCWPYIAFDVVK